MRCVFCGCTRTKVLDSRNVNGGTAIRRRKECLNCGKRFTTYEKIETNPVIVIKNDHSRQPFELKKLKQSIIIACDKRPVNIEIIDKITEELKTEIFNCGEQEISSSKIGTMVLNYLKNIDELACVRYAIVFKQFASIKDLLDFVNSFIKR